MIDFFLFICSWIVTFCWSQTNFCNHCLRLPFVFSLCRGMDQVDLPNGIVFFDSWNDLNAVYYQTSHGVRPYIWKHRYVQMLGLRSEETIEEVVNICHQNMIIFTLYRKVYLDHE